jgi:hypothetical protein
MKTGVQLKKYHCLFTHSVYEYSFDPRQETIKFKIMIMICDHTSASFIFGPTALEKIMCFHVQAYSTADGTVFHVQAYSTATRICFMFRPTVMEKNICFMSRPGALET